jgi:capsular exopolysaccharide synthesis family protein
MARWGKGRLVGAVDAARRDEAFRIVRSNLEVATLELERNLVMITSPNAGEGKTSTSSNLAMAFAASGRRVILVDLDLRHPDVHRRFGAHNERGVTDVLLGEAELADCLQFVEVGESPGKNAAGLFLLPAGRQPSNPSELLGITRSARLLNHLVEQAELVLIDAPPVLPVADALVIGRLAAGVVLVAEARQTTYPQIQRAVDTLTRSQCRLLGVVLNKQRAHDDLYGYGEGY